MSLPCHGWEEFSQEGLLPTETLVGVGGCSGGCPVPPGQGEGETPQTTGALPARHGAASSLGICRVPQEGWAGEGCPLQLVPKLRKTNWSATGHPLPFGELRVCPRLPVGFGVFCSQGGERQRLSEPGGCGMLSLGDRGGFTAGMGPQRGTHRHVTVERRVLSRPCRRCRPTGSVPGLASGCCESGSDCREQRSCSYLWISNGGCKKRKRKSPSGSFHHQFMAMTTMPILPLRSSSPSVPRTLPTHSVTRFSPALPV